MSLEQLAEAETGTASGQEQAGQEEHEANAGHRFPP